MMLYVFVRRRFRRQDGCVGYDRVVSWSTASASDLWFGGIFRDAIFFFFCKPSVQKGFRESDTSTN